MRDQMEPALVPLLGLTNPPANEEEARVMAAWLFSMGAALGAAAAEQWTSRAMADLERLDPAARSRVTRAIEQFSRHRHGDVKRLRKPAGEWRLRVGDLRVRFIPRRESIHVLRVLPRSAAYYDS